ncbi:MAG: hypothetical protein E3K37_12345 [Candidatus Kuenenia sp.]|nr:hypothetical protein [Candidatus Kuenenia hertensis]
MERRDEIGTITLKINPEQLRKIANSGRLEEFVVKATEIFRRDLKTELVTEVASSVSTSLFFEDDEYGTGPRPPHWWNIKHIETLTTRIQVLEQALNKQSLKVERSI